MRFPRNLRGTDQFPVVVVLGALNNRVGDFGQPCTVLDGFQHICRTEELDAVGRRVAERLKETGGHESGNGMRRAVQEPSHLLDGDSGGRLAAQRQKSMLFLVHGSPKAIPPSG